MIWFSFGVLGLTQSIDFLDERPVYTASRGLGLGTAKLATA
jgi:hypothetical protein